MASVPFVVYKYIGRLCLKQMWELHYVAPTFLKLLLISTCEHLEQIHEEVGYTVNNGVQNVTDNVKEATNVTPS